MFTGIPGYSSLAVATTAELEKAVAALNAARNHGNSGTVGTTAPATSATSTISSGSTSVPSSRQQLQASTSSAASAIGSGQLGSLSDPSSFIPGVIRNTTLEQLQESMQQRTGRPIKGEQL